MRKNHNLNYVKNEFEDIFKRLETVEGFADMFSNIKECDFCYWLDTHEVEINNLGIDFSYGVTRVVFWDNEKEDYVMKIQYGTRGSNKTEAEAYEFAEIFGLDKFFAWNKFIMEYKGNNIYGMEFCNINDEEMSDKIDEYYYREYCLNNWCEDNDETREEFWDDYYCEHDTHDMLELAKDYWYEEDLEEVTILLDLFEINDLHCGNWGFVNYDGYDHLVITDYAGY